MVERYTDYDAFARLYDRYWGPKSLQRLDVLEPLVLRRLRPHAAVLDLCCGTGQIARALTDRGFHVLGIDGSAGMLAYARRNAPHATFLLSDARTFEVDQDLDAALCLFDSLNHLMSEEDLGRAFLSVSSALRPGAVFAFDLNMEVKYLRTWSGEFHVLGAHDVGIVRASVEEEARLGHFDITFFSDEPDGTWSRHDLRLTQTWYGEETVARLLVEAGFESPSMHVTQPMPDDPGVAQNLLFVAVKAKRGQPRDGGGALG